MYDCKFMSLKLPTFCIKWCSAAEFVIYKLKELGKIDVDDVLDVLKEFHALDHDQSGHLNCSDLRMMHLAKQPAPAA